MDFPKAGPVSLRTNLADYPVTMGLKDGRVSSPLINFDFCGPKTAHNGFKAMIRESAFDAGELALFTYLQAKAYGKPLVMLPAPISGRFQHHCIGYNIEFGHLNPKDIEGKKVAVRSYTQTTGIWVRGVLQHEYGVDIDKVTWLTQDDAHLAEYSDPENCERLPKGSDIPQMMLNGEVAAAILGVDMPADPRVRTLVPDPFAAAEDWYKREHLIPINHMFVVHQDLSKSRPDVVRELYRLIAESRELAPEAVRLKLPPLGLDANRRGIELAIEWAYDQKIIPRRLKFDELFDDATYNLGHESTYALGK